MLYYNGSVSWRNGCKTSNSKERQHAKRRENYRYWSVGTKPNHRLDRLQTWSGFEPWRDRQVRLLGKPGTSHYHLRGTAAVGIQPQAILTVAVNVPPRVPPMGLSDNGDWRANSCASRFSRNVNIMAQPRRGCRWHRSHLSGLVNQPLPAALPSKTERHSLLAISPSLPGGTSDRS